MSNAPTTPADGPHRGLNLAQVRGWALEAGFAEAGLVALPHAADARDAERFEEWIAADNAGAMRYLERRSEDGQLLRARVAIPFPWARSAIVCFAGYHSAQPLSTQPAESDAGWIARYAHWPEVDRPEVDSPAAQRLSQGAQADESAGGALHEQFGEFEARGFVDTGPVVERALATAAGLGWTGKNTCLIHPKLGSFGFLAVLLTSLEIGEEKVPTALSPTAAEAAAAAWRPARPAL